MRGRAKCRDLISSLSPQSGAYSAALKRKKSLSPPIPIGGGQWLQMAGAQRYAYTHNTELNGSISTRLGITRAVSGMFRIKSNTQKMFE